MNSGPYQSSMIASAIPGRTTQTRILCLGNDQLADDALGSMVAQTIRQFVPEEVDVVATSEAGLRLLDYLLEAERVLVIDTVLTHAAPVGTVYELDETQLAAIPGRSSHGAGLCEVLALARELGLPVAQSIIVLAVEAADCSTPGGQMHPAVPAAIPALVGLVQDLLAAQLGDGLSSLRTTTATCPESALNPHQQHP